MVEDVAIGVAAELVAARVCFPLATAVLLPGVARLVIAIAVELDSQPLLGPAAVHPSPARRAVGLREGQVGFAKAGGGNGLRAG